MEALFKKPERGPAWEPVIEPSYLPGERDRRAAEAARVDTILQRMRIQDPLKTAFQPEVLVTRVTKDLITIRINIWAAHRDHRTMGWIGSHHAIPHGVEAEAIHAQVFLWLKSLIMHEVQESILVDGVRKWDPHA